MRSHLFRSLFWWSTACLALVACAKERYDTRERVSGETTAAMTASLVTPENPSRSRPVHLVETDEAGVQSYVRPQYPAYRTSTDGRIAIQINTAEVHLIAPERLNGHLQDNVGSQVVAPPGGADPLVLAKPYAGAGALKEITFCDPGGNPRNIGGDDVYELFTIETRGHDSVVNTAALGTDGGTDGGAATKATSLWRRKVEIKVSNPKTATAAITSVADLGGYVKASVDYPVDDIFEPIVSADGHLLVGSMNGQSVDLDGLVTKTHLFYVKSAAWRSPCDIQGWSFDLARVHRVTHAFADPEVHGLYGFADQQLRDSEGNLIPDGEDLHATYPWMDRAGRNLFFSTVNATLHHLTDGGSAQPQVQTRFSSRCVSVQGVPLPCPQVATKSDLAATNPTVEFSSTTRGLAVAGRWTNGKVVLLDGMLNNIDYGLDRDILDQREVQLYSGVGPASVATDGYVRLGTGRATGGDGPANNTSNSNHIESPEHVFNHDPRMVPRTQRDVVWIMASGKSTDEVVFDDYMDPDVVVFSDMTASLSWLPWNGVGNDMSYHDGFRLDDGDGGSGFVDLPRVQNAAGSTKYAPVPRYGAVHNGRIEPAALGGVFGKGLWLETTSHVDYDFTAAPAPSPASVYVGVFVDPRGGLAATRRLLTFPSGDSVDIENNATVLVNNAAAGITLRATMPRPLVEGTFQHIGLMFTPSGAQFYLDGFRFQSDPIGFPGLFLPRPSSLLVLGGAGAAEGFRGWTDELKVIFRAPTTEERCNHARGTMARIVPGGGTAALLAAANLYPPSYHEELRALLGDPMGSRYVCFHDYTTDLQPPIPPLNLAMGGLEGVRAALLGLPSLRFGAPRPASQANAFCLGCHQAVQVAASLEPAALIGMPGLPLQNDPRRQPLQPPPIVNGHVPAGYVKLRAPFLPGAGAAGANQPLDRWVYP